MCLHSAPMATTTTNDIDAMSTEPLPSAIRKIVQTFFNCLQWSGPVAHTAHTIAYDWPVWECAHVNAMQTG